MEPAHIVEKILEYPMLTISPREDQFPRLAKSSSSLRAESLAKTASSVDFLREPAEGDLRVCGLFVCWNVAVTNSPSMTGKTPSHPCGQSPYTDDLAQALVPYERRKP